MGRPRKRERLARGFGAVGAVVLALLTGGARLEAQASHPLVVRARVVRTEIGTEVLASARSMLAASLIATVARRQRIDVGVATVIRVEPARSATERPRVVAIQFLRN